MIIDGFTRGSTTVTEKGEATECNRCMIVCSIMQEYEERLRPFEPFWRLLNEPKTPAPTGSPSENAAQHGAMLERSAKMFDRAASKGMLLQRCCR